MEKPNFLNTETSLNDIEQLKDESSYFKNIKELEGKGKFIKKIKEFSTSREAQEYLSNRPQKENNLRGFLPDTSYIIGESEGTGCAVYAIVEIIDGERLDSLDLCQQEQQFYEQLDDFLFESLKIYEDSGRCPGMNLRNLVLSKAGKLVYVDSEPYPEYNIELFEMAHARNQKLIKIFGNNYSQLLPKTAAWITKYEVENFKKAKSESNKKRRLKSI